MLELPHRVTIPDLAKAAGVSYQAAEKWYDGRTKSMRSEYAHKVANWLGVNEQWLSTGKGPIRSVAAPRADYAHAQQSYVKVSSYDVELPTDSDALIWTERAEQESLLFHPTFFPFRQHKADHSRALRVDGRSMEPALGDGDTVLIDTTDSRIVDGEIYALMVGAELFIKYVDRLQDGIRLRSSNPSFSSLELKGEELDKLKVLGRVFWRAG
ncbi:S24 family peptidase [Chitinimonas arctica]|nr:LexA family transcriptional regulator [Chitinimonas arctica]